ncbi:helix-turn-helix transcriptional regulator [Paraneptunicella aestuarii]|uniref:helix-turn-helix transcriptional regulator n=1 Tax=Paraneptunicella aestuarii TaxID=2831148 RepID=UPI001E5D7209|nr:helix-turn-helix transcriptional regulator [Paraneptunicella aestuarii]UAA37242.1 helix-turn-helix transcriptional regulator [Paraneptunicella aestuarii]
MVKHRFTGDNLRAMRLHGKKTTIELAKIAGVSRQTYSSWECGVGKPRYDQFLLIASACGLTNVKGLLNEMAVIVQEHIEKNAIEDTKGFED